VCAGQQGPRRSVCIAHLRVTLRCIAIPPDSDRGHAYTMLLPALSRGVQVLRHCAQLTAAYSLASVTVLASLLSAASSAAVEERGADILRAPTSPAVQPAAEGSALALCQDLLGALVTSICTLLPERVPGYCEPSLAYLAAHYQVSARKRRKRADRVNAGNTNKSTTPTAFVAYTGSLRRDSAVMPCPF